MVLTQADKDKPIQHILGETKFYGLWFSVTEDTFIPRPETEVLVDHIIKKYKGKRNKRLIDLGTGCGNIAVTLAKYLRAEIYAVDISLDALEIAGKNAKRHGVEERVKFICSDWLKDVRSGPFDIIVSNPPYIKQEEWDSLPNNVKDYEPRIALWGGEEGLEHYKKIVSYAAEFLVPGGEIVFEIGWNQGQLVSDLLDKSGIFTNISVKKDLGGNDRIVAALLAKRAVSHSDV